MRVTRFRGEKDIQELVGRLYDLDRGGPTPAAAAARLAAANRHLPLRSRSLAKALEPGTLIAVPELEGATNDRSTSSLGEAAAHAAQARAAAALEQLARGFDADRRRSLDELERVQGLIDSEDFRAAAAEDKELAARLEAVGRAVEDRRARLAAVEQAQRRALDGAQRGVERLALALSATHDRPGGAGGPGPADGPEPA